jgi:hypothetical protein
MPGWTFDGFFWLVMPIAVLEAARIARSEIKLERRYLNAALGHAALELFVLGVCAATASPLVFALLNVLRVFLQYLREGEWLARRMTKTALICAGMLLLMGVGVGSFEAAATADLAPLARLGILGLIGSACVLSILPVRIADEPKETLVAPIALIAFARVALPLGAAEPRFALVVPIVAGILSLVCALLLMSAGTRANQFEPSTLVSEILVCERGVILSFVWMGLASGEDLAEVGGLLFWWSGALALLALEASLRRRPLPKPMAFFALAMAVSLPGTLGFVAEDLLAHGLLELRPLLAAGFMAVTAINAAALYLALVNIIVDLQSQEQEDPDLLPAGGGRTSVMMLTAAGLSLLLGLAPAPFVDLATRAQTSVVQHRPASEGALASHALRDPG